MLHAFQYVITLGVIQAAIPFQVVKERYGHFAREEATLRVIFVHSEITLDIPDDGLVTEKGWRITPLTAPTVSKVCLDHHHEYVCILCSDRRSPGRMQISSAKVSGSLSVS